LFSLIMLARHYAPGAIPFVLSVLFVLASSAHAGLPTAGEEANVAVSLSIEQSCLVHSAAAGQPQTAPQVECLHDELYAVSQTAREPTGTLLPVSGSMPASSPAMHAVTPVQSDVWMVAF
jgi:hypothetical protein